MDPDLCPICGENQSTTPPELLTLLRDIVNRRGDLSTQLLHARALLRTLEAS